MMWPEWGLGRKITTPRELLIGAFLQAPKIPDKHLSEFQSNWWLESLRAMSLVTRHSQKLTHNSAALMSSGSTSEHCPQRSWQIRRRTSACRCQYFHSFSSFSLSSGDIWTGSLAWRLARRAWIVDFSLLRRLISCWRSDIRGFACRAANSARAFFSFAFRVEISPPRLSMSSLRAAATSGVVISEGSCRAW
jgi:hypothetical protein